MASNKSTKYEKQWARTRSNKIKRLNAMLEKNANNEMAKKHLEKRIASK